MVLDAVDDLRGTLVHVRGCGGNGATEVVRGMRPALSDTVVGGLGRVFVSQNNVPFCAAVSCMSSATRATSASQAFMVDGQKVAVCDKNARGCHFAR